MDEECKSIIPNETNNPEEVNLPEVVASLKMLAVNMSEEEEISPVSGQRRSLRKRKPRNLDFTQLNRRCNVRPRKRTFSDMENEDQIKEYYLDKTVKKYTNSLETIFEEKDDMSQTTCMSAKRFKRMITFTDIPTDTKLKKRREKIRRVFGSKVHKRRRNVSMQALLDRLNGLQNDLPLNNTTEIKLKTG